MWEITEINKKIKKCLVSKYLFFKADGSFESRIKKGISDEIWLEGKLEKSGDITLSYKQRMLDNNSTLIKYFEGQVRSNEICISATGKLFEVDPNKDEKIVRPECLLLDFSNTLWKAEYTEENNNKTAHKFNVYLYHKNGLFSGVSNDDRGFACWAGILKDEGKVSLVQQYLDKSHTPSSDSGVYSYSGIFDQIAFVIEGTVNSSEMEGSSKFTIKRVGKLYKQ